MAKKKRQVANVSVGKADTKLTRPSHVPGVKEGNSPGGYEDMDGHNDDGTSTARRSTGIRPGDRNPVLPDSPNLSPP